MHVAILGGGLQGCCTALALASQGITVTIFDGRSRLMDGAASANEGKIHLGYMYANDPSLTTAKLMMRGALSFEPFLRQHLSCSSEIFQLSQPAIYSVHRQSQVSHDKTSAYLTKVHALVGELIASDPTLSYFGQDVLAPLRQWSDRERNRAFSAQDVLDAHTTPEIAINPSVLSDLMRRRIMDDPRIEKRLDHKVLSLKEEAAGIRVEFIQSKTTGSERFDQVVNCLWDGRLEIDQSLGCLPKRPWLHRLKYGVRLHSDSARHIPSTTIISGPFGEVVNYGDGLLFLTWYPTCVRALSPDIAPPAWPLIPTDQIQLEIASTTTTALTEVVPSLSLLHRSDIEQAKVQGGVIVAWGSTDVYDPNSELHQRFSVGVSSIGRYHSIDPGKLTLAPYFAQQCCDRIISN